MNYIKMLFCVFFVMLISSCAVITNTNPQITNPNILFAWEVGDTGWNAPSVLNATKIAEPEALGLAVSPPSTPSTPTTAGTNPVVNNSYVKYKNVYLQRRGGAWFATDYSREETIAPITFGNSGTSWGVQLMVGTRDGGIPTAATPPQGYPIPVGQFDLSSRKIQVTIETLGFSGYAENDTSITTLPQLQIFINNTTTTAGNCKIGAVSLLNVQKQGETVPNTGGYLLLPQKGGTAENPIVNSEYAVYAAQFDPTSLSADAKNSLKNGFLQIRISSSTTAGSKYGGAVVLKSIRIEYID